MHASKPTASEGFGALRLLLVLSSLFPVFVLFAIRGQSPLPECYHLLMMLALATAPTAILAIRIAVAKRNDEIVPLAIGTATSHQSSIISYLLALLLPFVGIATSDWRGFAASMATVVFVVIVLWLMKVHYLNVIFGLLNRTVFEVLPPDCNNPFSDRNARFIVTWRTELSDCKSINALRITDTVYWEKKYAA